MAYESLKHSRWKCKYHVVFIPKYRKKKLFGELKQYMGELFRELAKQKECRIEEGHLMIDHVHMLISIPPKYSVDQVIGFIKPTWGERRILRGKVFGHGAIWFRQWVEMKP